MLIIPSGPQRYYFARSIEELEAEIQAAIFCKEWVIHIVYSNRGFFILFQSSPYIHSQSLKICTGSRKPHFRTANQPPFMTHAVSYPNGVIYLFTDCELIQNTLVQHYVLSAWKYSENNICDIPLCWELSDGTLSVLSAKYEKSDYYDLLDLSPDLEPLLDDNEQYPLYHLKHTPYGWIFCRILEFNDIHQDASEYTLRSQESESFPADWLDSQLSKGFIITLVAYENNRWQICLASKTSSRTANESNTFGKINSITFCNDKNPTNVRTFFRSEELEEFLVEANITFQQAEEKTQEITFELEQLDGETPGILASQQQYIYIQHCPVTLNCRNVFEVPAPDKGTYRIHIRCNQDLQKSSESFEVCPGPTKFYDYFTPYFFSLDKADNTEPEARHSFSSFEQATTSDIILYFGAYNLLEKEWTYEFVIRLYDPQNNLRSTYQIHDNTFYTDSASQRPAIQFNLALGDGHCEFWKQGKYRIEIDFMDQRVFSASFQMGDTEYPHDYNKEIQSLAECRQNTGTSPRSKDLSSALSRLNQMIGLQGVKKEISRLTQQCRFIHLRQEKGFNDTHGPRHMLFLGNPGTGKTTVAEIIGDIFYQTGILANGKTHRYLRKHLTGEFYGSEEKRVREIVQECQGGVLFIDEAYNLYVKGDPKDPGRRILEALMDILDNEHPELLVIMAGYPHEMQQMLGANPGLKDRFPIHLHFEDYSPEELMDIALLKASSKHYHFHPEAAKKLSGILKIAHASKDRFFSNGRYIENKLQEIIGHLSERLMASAKKEFTSTELTEILPEDIPNARPSEGSPLEKINRLTGLTELKQNISKHIHFVNFLRARQAHGFYDAMPPLHMIFTGNPGTGKTTVARMMGEIYHQMGILSRPHVLVRNRADLVGNPLNSPEEAVLSALDTARGGILFIDEAYTLAQDTAGRQVMEALLAPLSEQGCNDTIVILAGYTDEMKALTETNPGIKSRFPYTFHFSDYTPEELLRIALRQLKDKNYRIEKKAIKALYILIRRAYETKDAYFGNARFVSKTVDKLIQNLSLRLGRSMDIAHLGAEELSLIRATDIPISSSDILRYSKRSFDEKEIRATLRELDQLVGQNQLKRQIHHFVNLARLYHSRGIRLNTQMSLQWSLVGPTGMGKSSVAQIIGRLYKAMGLLNKGHVIDFKADKLLDQTFEYSRQVLSKALQQSAEGIFMLDEDSPKLEHTPDFRRNLRSLLMSLIAEYPGSYTLIYAEREAPHEILNPDIENVSDLINVLVFEEYTQTELLAILRQKLAQEGVKLTPAACIQMNNFISQLLTRKPNNYASARLMKTISGLITRNCYQRLANINPSTPPSNIITALKQDVAQFTPELLKSRNLRKQIGFK